MTTVETLARFIAGFDPSALSAPLERAARRCLLDLIGAACAGHETMAAGAARSISQQTFAQGPSSVWFSNLHLIPAAAAFANAAAASAWDLDDGHRPAAGHPGAGVIPACVALTQEKNATFEDLFSAMALGYEIGCRVAASRNFNRLPTLASGRWVAYGVAASAAFFYRLSPQKTAHALSIAGIHSPDMAAAGYSKQMGNSIKEGIPWAALTGMTAVSLAEKGFTGPLDILDHPDYYDASSILKALGNRWAIEEVYFKPYGCCRWAHAAIEALLSLMAEQHLTPGAIEDIEVETFRRAVEGLTNDPQPDNVESAQYSLPFSMAVAAYEGQEGLLPLQPELLKRPDLSAFARKIILRVDPGLDRFFPERSPARVKIRARGRIFEKTILDPLGDPRRPLSDSQLMDKFNVLTKNFLSLHLRSVFLTLLEKRPTGKPSELLELSTERL